MQLINPTRIFNNLIALAVIGWIFFMIWTKLDQEKVKGTIEGIKKLFRGKEE